MKNKLVLFIFGSLLTVSITSPPELLNNLPINLSDILIIFASIYIFINLINQFKLSEILFEIKNTYWLYIIVVFTISFFLYGFNSLTIRFIFYTIFGFLCYLFVKNYSINELQYIFIPFFAISLLNFVTVIFELSFLDNTTGWITYYYENPNFFNKGRLSGYQGGGPNVAGALFTFLTFINFYFFKLTKNKIYFIFSLLNVFLIFITFSRGSYLAFGVSIIIYLFINNFKIKTIIFYFIVFLGSTFLFLVNTNSEILLKESDRGYLTQIAIDNLSLFNGYGGGNYVEEIYGNYFLSINPEILEQNLNIKLDKVELGITPEEYRNTGVDFFIGTSGGGYEILVQSNIASDCSEDRTTCQYVRVELETLVKFISVIIDKDYQFTENFIVETKCKSNLETLFSRGEFSCIVDKMFTENFLSENKNLTRLDFFVQCEVTSTYDCKSRKLSIGELSVIVENISLSNNLIPVENYKLFCQECQFRNVNGYIKIQFDKKQGILPRSIFKFFTSENGKDWDQVGFTRTKGKVIDFTSNNSYIEIGGHSDGQSFGNTFLDSVIKSVQINTKSSQKEIIFIEELQNQSFFIFKPNTTDYYNAKVTYEDFGLKLYKPNKYWIALENDYDFTDDFEIIINLSFPEIPWGRQTLISNTSILNNQIQSWKVDMHVGRLFFYWTDEEGVFTEPNVIGDKSLRSGLLVAKNGFISNQSSPIVDPSFLSQLTTAHNGYLTFAVEYGLFIALIFYLIIFYYMYKIILISDNQSKIIYLCLVAFTIQNITNDMFYSADLFILFNLIFSIIVYSTKLFETKKS